MTGIGKITDNDFAVFLLFLVLVFAAFLPALGTGFIWDDDISVTKNPQMRSVAGLTEIWAKPAKNAAEYYFPLTYSAFWLQYQVWGDSPFGYHLVNLILHAANSFLVFLVLRRLAVPGALLAGLIFALHPVHVESAAWVTELKDVQSGFFYLLSGWSYLRFLEAGKRKWYAAALVFFVCAALTKSSAISLPAALLAVSVWKQGRLERGEVLRLSPFFLAAAGVAAMGLHMSSGFDFPWEYSPIERCVIAGWALWFYVWKLVWPWPLLAMYPMFPIDAGAAWQYLFPLSAAAAPATLWFFRKRLGSGPLTAVVYFGLTVGMFVGFLDFPLMGYTFVADRFQYLAGIGLTALFSAGAAMAAERLRMGLRGRAFCVAGLILVLGGLTFNQARYYEDNESLFRHVMKYNSSNPYANDKMGLALKEKGKVDEAIPYFVRSLELHPGDANVRLVLAGLLRKTGRWQEAAEEFREASTEYGKIEGSDAGVAEAAKGLALALADGKQGKEAEEALKQAIGLKPKDGELRMALGRLYYESEAWEAALAEFLDLTRLFPQSAAAHTKAGRAYENLNRMDEAVGHYSRALKLKPGLREAEERLRELDKAKKDK